MRARLMALQVGIRRNIYGRENGPGTFPAQKVIVNAMAKALLGVIFAVTRDNLVEAEASNYQSED